MVVAVDVVVGIIDGGCAGIVVGDMAMSRGVLECVLRVCVAVLLVWGAVWVLESTWAFFSAVGLSSSSDFICRAAL